MNERVMPPLPACPFRRGQELVHLKSGGRYRFLGLARIESSLESRCVYESIATGDWWIRPTAEMFDGRFRATDPDEPS